VSNRFKNKLLHTQYEKAVTAYKAKHRNLFHEDGSANTMNAVGVNFWRGFNGTQLGTGFTDAISRSTPAYAAYRAGQDMKQALLLLEAKSKESNQ